jgi:predicted nucleotidyltransferase
MRRPRDRDFVETAEGLLFCVVGYVHPPDRYTAYLKYVPAATGKWARGETAYRRELPYYHVRHVVKTVDYLQAHHPRYVWRDPASELTFSFVPGPRRGSPRSWPARGTRSRRRSPTWSAS